MKTADRLMAGVLFLCSAFMLYKTSELKELAYQILSNRLFPNLTFSLIILLSLILFAGTFWQTEDAGGQGQWRRMVGPRRMVLLGLFTTYLVVIPLVGFLPATGVFVVASAAWLSPRRRRDVPIALAVALAAVALIYGVFVFWLEAFLP